MMLRVASALCLAAAFFGGVWLLPSSWFRGLVVLVTVLSLKEYIQMCFSDLVEATSVFLVGIVLAIAMQSECDPAQLLLLLPLALFVLSLLFMARSGDLVSTVHRLSVAAFGMLYLGIAFAFWGWLRSLAFGRELVLLGLVAASLTDTFGFLVGKTWGRHRFAPLVSPKKTWEGFFAALCGSLLGTSIVWYCCLRSLFSGWHIFGFAFMIWLVAPFGDLIESMIKRSVHVKDSGKLIPGHGGLLDRIDALVFTGAFMYLYATAVLGL